MSSNNFLCGELDRLQDFRVAGAAAEISRQGLTDLVARRLRILIQQHLCGEENSRDAIAALRRAEIGKSALQRMRFAILHHAFHGHDLGIHRFNAEHQARQHRLAVDEDGAGAAFAQLATMLRAGEPHVFAQDLKQSLVDLGRDFVDFAVDSKAQERFFQAADPRRIFFFGSLRFASARV